VLWNFEGDNDESSYWRNRLLDDECCSNVVHAEITKIVVVRKSKRPRGKRYRFSGGSSHARTGTQLPERSEYAANKQSAPQLGRMLVVPRGRGGHLQRVVRSNTFRPRYGKPWRRDKPQTLSRNTRLGNQTNRDAETVRQTLRGFDTSVESRYAPGVTVAPSLGPFLTPPPLPVKCGYINK